MGRSITTKKFGVLALKMHKEWLFKIFDLRGWGQNGGWGQKRGQILIGNG